MSQSIFQSYTNNPDNAGIPVDNDNDVGFQWTYNVVILWLRETVKYFRDRRNFMSHTLNDIKNIVLSLSY